MLTALGHGPGNRGKDLINYPGIVKTPFIKELFLDFKARSGYINSSNEELIVAEEAIKEKEEEDEKDKVKEEEEEIDEPRLDSGGPV